MTLVPCPAGCKGVQIDTEKDIGPRTGLPSCYRCGATVKTVAADDGPKFDELKDPVERFAWAKRMW